MVCVSPFVSHMDREGFIHFVSCISGKLRNNGPQAIIFDWWECIAQWSTSEIPGKFHSILIDSVPRLTVDQHNEAGLVGALEGLLVEQFKV